MDHLVTPLQGLRLMPRTIVSPNRDVTLMKIIIQDWRPMWLTGDHFLFLTVQKLRTLCYHGYKHCHCVYSQRLFSVFWHDIYFKQSCLFLLRSLWTELIRVWAYLRHTLLSVLVLPSSPWVTTLLDEDSRLAWVCIQFLRFGRNESWLLP